MALGEIEPAFAPIIAGPGSPAIHAAGTSLVAREWTDSGPSYLHVHRSDDEAWHVLEGPPRFRFSGREVGTPPPRPRSSCPRARRTHTGWSSPAAT